MRPHFAWVPARCGLRPAGEGDFSNCKQPLGAVYNSFCIPSLTRLVCCPPPRPSPTGEGVVWWAIAGGARNGAGLNCKQPLGVIANSPGSFMSGLWLPGVMVASVAPAAPPMRRRCRAGRGLPGVRGRCGCGRSRVRAAGCRGSRARPRRRGRQSRVCG